MPVGIEPGIESAVLSPLKNTGQVTQSDGCCDLCNGTGGTGKIISIGENAITIRSKKGVNEVIRITDRTTLKNSRGDIAKTTLKIGDSVTVVIDETENASLILVCGIAKK